MSKNLTLEEIKAKTLEIMDSTDLSDVEYITQDLIDKNYEAEEDIKTVNTIYGHNMTYWGNNYSYQRGTGDGSSKSNACGEDKDVYLPYSRWDHKSLSDKCTHGSTNHSYISKFTRK